MTDGNTIRSVAKAMELLQLLSDAGEAMTLTAISERAGLPKSTVFGLLTTMRDYDVITQHADGKYALGLRLFEYGCRASAFWNISSLARPYLEHLAEATGASAMLSTYENGHIVALDQAEGRDSLRIVSAPGARLPLHCTSQGKIVLACMSESEAWRLSCPCAAHALHPAHRNGLGGALLASLPACREAGFAVENGEYKIGLRSISAPVFTGGGALKYVVSVLGMFRSVHSDEFAHAGRAVVAAGRCFPPHWAIRESETFFPRGKIYA